MHAEEARTIGARARMIRRRRGWLCTYLVRLTEPLRIDGTLFPGWWAFHDPDSIPRHKARRSAPKVS